MGEIADRIKGLLHGVGWVWAGIISLGLAIGSAALATAIVVNWAPDRFKADHDARFLQHRHALVRWLGIAGKNLLGVLLLLLGIIMALPGVPGQGLLVMVIGLTLINFPGKQRIELWCIRRPTLRKAINRLRARFHKPALELD
ncbi:MAG TPA: hypothetical protein VH374_12520 [Polyangia bacterium]|nr:hypothetical protein [Polyangia bacterium]